MFKNIIEDGGIIMGTWTTLTKKSFLTFLSPNMEKQRERETMTNHLNCSTSTLNGINSIQIMFLDLKATTVQNKVVFKMRNIFEHEPITKLSIKYTGGFFVNLLYAVFAFFVVTII